MNIQKLQAVKTIVVHDNCSDGLMSAILLKDAFGQHGWTPELKFVQYGTEAYKKLEPAPDMMFCDFSPNIKTVKQPDGSYVIDEADKPRLQAWVDSGTLILDHHAGAKPVVEAFGSNGVFGDEKLHPGVSGAVLAYRHVWLPFYVLGNWKRRQQFGEKYEEPIVNAPSTVEELATQLENDLSGVQDFHDKAIADTESEVHWAHSLAKIVGVRDTWQNKHPLWRDACVLNEVLRFYPQEEWLADNRVMPFHPGNRGFWSERLKLGDLLWTKHEKKIKKAVEKSWRFTTPKGTRVVMFEGVRMSSDVAEALDAEADLIIGFDYECEAPKDGGPTIRKIIYSTRSHTDFNCTDLAKEYGGGGHTKAAGFNVEFDKESTPNSLSRYAYTLNPYSLAETLVRMHEEKQQQGT